MSHDTRFATCAGSLSGRVALVTGAARGQGRVEALRLADEGADVICLDACRPIEGIAYEMPTTRDLDEVAAEIGERGDRCVHAVVDVRDAEGMAKAVDDAVGQLGRLDIVVANAGVLSSSKTHWETDVDVWQTVLSVNLTGVWLTMRACVPHMIASGNGGSIILISSIAGDRGAGNVVAYVAAKHGVVGLMRTAANELAAHNIRVNTIHPTNVRTPMIDNPHSARIFSPDLPDPVLEDGIEALTSVNLMPVPWIDSSNVADAVVFLAGDASAFITGAMLPVDAGSLAKWPS